MPAMIEQKQNKVRNWTENWTSEIHSPQNEGLLVGLVCTVLRHIYTQRLYPSSCSFLSVQFGTVHRIRVGRATLPLPEIEATWLVAASPSRMKCPRLLPTAGRCRPAKCWSVDGRGPTQIEWRCAFPTNLINPGGLGRDFLRKLFAGTRLPFAAFQQHGFRREGAMTGIKFLSISGIHGTLPVDHHLKACCMKCCPLITKLQPVIEMSFFLLPHPWPLAPSPTHLTSPAAQAGSFSCTCSSRSS